MNISDYIIEKVKLNSEREPPLLFSGNRWNWLPDLCNLAEFKVGVEVGVSGGRFSKRLCETVAGLTLYAIDPWTIDERSYRKALETLTPLEDCHIIRDYSARAVSQFEDSRLDFIYLDADRWFESVTQDLDLWTHKVREGGIICGCCYYNVKGTDERVKDAVDAWTQKRGIDPWFVLVHHKYPCYLWQK